MKKKKTLFVIYNARPLQLKLYCFHYNVFINLGKQFPLVFVSLPSVSGRRFWQHQGIPTFCPFYPSVFNTVPYTSMLLIGQIKAWIKRQIKKVKAEQVVLIGHTCYFKEKLNLGVKEINITLFEDAFYPFSKAEFDHVDKMLFISHKMYQLTKDSFEDKRELYPQFVPDSWLSLHQPRPQNKSIGYFGNLTFERLDLSLIMNLADALEDYTFDFHGYFHSEYDEFLFNHLLAKKHNVRYLGGFDPDSFLTKAKNYHYGWIPYLKTSFNLGCSPTKLYQYLALGMEVISPNLFYEDSVLPLIHIYQSIEDILKIIKQKENRNIKEKTLNYLSKNTVSHRTDQIIKLIEG